MSEFSSITTNLQTQIHERLIEKSHNYLKIKNRPKRKRGCGFFNLDIGNLSKPVVQRGIKNIKFQIKFTPENRTSPDKGTRVDIEIPPTAWEHIGINNVKEITDAYNKQYNTNYFIVPKDPKIKARIVQYKHPEELDLKKSLDQQQSIIDDLVAEAIKMYDLVSELKNHLV